MLHIEGGPEQGNPREIFRDLAAIGLVAVCAGCVVTGIGRGMTHGANKPAAVLSIGHSSGKALELVGVGIAASGAGTLAVGLPGVMMAGRLRRHEGTAAQAEIEPETTVPSSESES